MATLKQYFFNVFSTNIYVLLIFAVMFLFQQSTFEKQKQSFDEILNAKKPVQRIFTYDQAMNGIHEFGKAINDSLKGDTKGFCKMKRFGLGWGSHFLCEDQIKPPCVFYSFGISTDYSFDVNLTSYGCFGVGLDPSIVHPSRLNSKLLFFHIGATSLNEEINNLWMHTSSTPSLKKFFNHQRINVLKYDCEGCEYALPKDILAEEPDFFYKIDQFAVEMHVSKYWISSSEHLYYLGVLYLLLNEAGLKLVDSKLSACSEKKEMFGCPLALLQYGYPCARSIMCQNFLFARLSS